MQVVGDKAGNLRCNTSRSAREIALSAPAGHRAPQTTGCRLDQLVDLFGAFDNTDVTDLACASRPCSASSRRSRRATATSACPCTHAPRGGAMQGRGEHTKACSNCAYSGQQRRPRSCSTPLSVGRGGPAQRIVVDSAGASRTDRDGALAEGCSRCGSRPDWSPTTMLRSTLKVTFALFPARLRPTPRPP